jgi:hypothetical protein
MRPSLKLTLFISILALSCTNNGQKISPAAKGSNSDSTHTIHSDVKGSGVKKQLISNDTLTVTEKGAVFYSPSSSRINKMKKERGEDFYVAADDNMYYMSTARDFLEQQKLAIMDNKDKKYIKFVFADKLSQVIKLDTVSQPWGIYFFDPSKRLYQADITMIQEEYKNFFK